MTDATAATPPRKRGPSTPEGKARSAMNALKHGLRARAFGLLPGEDPAEWALHLADLRAGYGPEDATEEKLVAAIAAAMWKEVRADGLEAETLSAIPPLGPGRPHGGDLQEPRHAASLTTAVRYGAGAGAAARRAQRAFFEHRKARRAGLLAPAAAGAGAQAPAVAANENFTNELSPAPASLGQVVPAPSPAPAKPAPARAAAGRGSPAPDDDPDGDDGLDDEAWLASLPVVEADPEQEAERRRALMRVEPATVRRTVGHGTLRQLEQYLAAGDPVAYEAWFARQPKPPRGPATLLTEADRAAVERVTRHNPPWIRGEYLSYYRPPVPAELFAPRPAVAAAAETAVPKPATIATPLADLRARVVRLLDRGRPRLAEELDLAEAVCAVKWPNWPAYAGAVDLGLLRRALEGVRVDAATLNWLDCHAFADACRAGSTPKRQPQGP